MAVATSSHWGTFCELQALSYTPNVWASRNKHGNFAYLSDCRGTFGDFCAGDCSNPGVCLPHVFYNVGEPDIANQMINDLCVVKCGWRGQTVWNGQKFFDAGKITDQLFLDQRHYPVPYVPPETDPCQQSCRASLDQCSARCEPLFFSDPEEWRRCYNICDSDYGWCGRGCWQR